MFPCRISVNHPDLFIPGDLIAFPRSGDRAFVVSKGGDGSLTLDGRFVRHVTERVVGYRDEWDGDEWITSEITDPMPIPHYEVRNLCPRAGDEVISVGSLRSAHGPV